MSGVGMAPGTLLHRDVDTFEAVQRDHERIAASARRLALQRRGRRRERAMRKYWTHRAIAGVYAGLVELRAKPDSLGRDRPERGSAVEVFTLQELDAAWRRGIDQLSNAEKNRAGAGAGTGCTGGSDNLG